MRAIYFILLLFFPSIVYSACPTDPPPVYTSGSGDFGAFVVERFKDYQSTQTNKGCKKLTINLDWGSSAYKGDNPVQLNVPGDSAAQTQGLDLTLQPSSPNVNQKSRISFSFGTFKSVTFNDMNFDTLTTPINFNTISADMNKCTFYKGYGVKAATSGTNNAKITITDSTFTELDMSSNQNDIHGFSAVYTQDALITVTRTTFSRINGRALKGNNVVSTDCVYDSNVIGTDFFVGKPTRGAAIFAINTVSIVNNLFINNKAGNGGAIYSKATSVTSATRNTFIGNVAFGTPNYDNYGLGGAIYAATSFNLGDNNYFGSNLCTKPDGTIGGAGGAIAIPTNTAPSIQSQISGRNITFFSNKAALGGAIYTTGTLLSIGAVYQSNEAKGVAGIALTGADSPPSLPTATGTNGGGAIYLASSTKTFESTNENYIGNQANSVGSQGGAVYSSGTVKISTTTSSILPSPSFQSNTANTNGGAIYSRSTVTTITATFNQNQATGGSGGAIYSNGAFSASSASIFSSNTASTNGGAVYASSTIATTSTTYSGNTAAGSGGGIFANGQVTTFTSNTLTQNTATNGNGGGIYSSTTLLLTSTGGSFLGNKAASGGGIYAAGAVTSTGVIFNQNQATMGSGGGVYSTGEFNSDSATSFTTNTATLGNGGAVFGATTVKTSSSFSLGNSAVNGGAMYATTGFTANSGASFSGNTASSSGGALYLNTAVSLNGINFQLNSATIQGGSIYSTSSIEMVGGYVKSSTAQSGGGIYSLSTVTTKTTTVTFENNEATGGEGGAIRASSVTLASSVFSGNKGTAPGQAIYVVGDSTITSGIFSNNLGGIGGNPSIVVPDGKKLDLIGSNTFTATNIILNGVGKVMKSGASVTILCDGTGRSPFGSDAEGYTSCMESSTVFTRVLFSTSSEGKNLAGLRSAVRGIVDVALADGNLYVDWVIRPTGQRRAIAEVHDASATFVLPSLTTNTPSDSYKWANNLQQAAAISTLTTAGYTPTFGANSTNTYAKQVLTTNECAYQDSNACNNNGYCVEPESQGIGYCSCKSGFSDIQCQTVESSRVSQAVAFGSLSWEPELLVTFESDVKIDVVIISQKNVIQDANNYATSTILRFGGTSNGCNYPKNDDWILTTKLASDGKWYDHYTQTFSYTQLIGCGLTRVNTDNTRYLFYNNTLDIERDYVSKQGTKFTFARKAKTNKPFSLMFPKTVATTSNIRVWNTTIEFFATVSQLNYITEDDKWHMKITTIIANNYRLKSKFVNEDETPTVPTVPPTDLSERNFMIVTETLNGDPKLPPLSCSTNEDCQQTFHFVFDKCKGFTISNYAFEFEVSCQPSKADCLPPQNTATVQLSLNAATEEKGSCPVDATFNPGAVMNSYDSGLTSTKTLFGMSETAYFAIDFTSPLQVDNIVIDNVCVHKTSQADGILCTTNIVDESIIGDRKGHRVAFSVLAKDLMTVSQTVGSGTVVVQADLTITYGSSFTSKRSVTMAPHSGTSVISLVDREVYEQSLLRGKLENEDAFVPSSATFFSASCALIFLVAFVAF